ncbi:MAG: glycosyltransferase, partial [Clostridia bacterium]|nr:glycosyltransferase [Clostridia bacterium]
MKQPLISIIVPVYRAEAYLPRCLDSLLSQDFEDFEILAVDDGSPDDSGKILEEYAARDGRIKVIHRENGGVSAARNTGLDAVSGAYI